MTNLPRVSLTGDTRSQSLIFSVCNEVFEGKGILYYLLSVTSTGNCQDSETQIDLSAGVSRLMDVLKWMASMHKSTAHMLQLQITPVACFLMSNTDLPFFRKTSGNLRNNARSTL